METLAHFKNDFVKNVTGYSSLGIILSTCLGSIAVLSVLSQFNGLLPMAFVLLSVSICSIHNAAILTVQKPIVIYRLLMASTLINLAIIVGSMFIR